MLHDSVNAKVGKRVAPLAQGIEVNAEDSTGATPLADAIRCGHREEQAALRGAGGRLGASDIAERLCVAAAANDLDTLNVRRATIWAFSCRPKVAAHMHGTGHKLRFHKTAHGHTCDHCAGPGGEWRGHGRLRPGRLHRAARGGRLRARRGRLPAAQPARR